MTTSSRTLGVLLLGVALVLGGCSGDVDDPAPSASLPTGSGSPSASLPTGSASPSSSAPADPTVSPSASASVSASPSPSASSTDGARGRPTSVVVEIDEVRNGCIYGTAPTGERWGLRGGDVEDLVIGERVRISGAPDDTRDEACPDGMPFLVDSYVPAT